MTGTIAASTAGGNTWTEGDTGTQGGAEGNEILRAANADCPGTVAEVSGAVAENIGTIPSGTADDNISTVGDTSTQDGAPCYEILRATNAGCPGTVAELPGAVAENIGAIPSCTAHDLPLTHICRRPRSPH